MEKFWNNEELEVMELLNPFTLPEKIEILKISIEQEPNPYNRKICLLYTSQAQLYSVLSLCWDNALRVGIPMKSLYESQSIEWEEITRFFIVIDEAHRIVNAGNLTAVQQLTIMAREDRKFFTGILMATQSILDLSLIHI